MKPMRRSGWFFGACTLLCLAAGCGPRMATVYGKLTNGTELLKGSPMQGQPTSMAFVPIVDSGPPQPGYDAPVDQDTATYKVRLPVGKYRIAVHHALPGFKEQFPKLNEKDSPIIRDITADQQLDIDVQKPGG